MRLLAWMPRLRRAPLATLWKHLERASPARHGSSDRYVRFELSPLEERRVLCAGGVAAPAPALIAGAALAPTPSSSPATGTIAPTDQTTGALLSNLKTSGADSIDDIGDTGESASDDATDGGSSAGATTDGGGASAGSSHAAVAAVLSADAATASPALAGVATPAASSNFTETSGVLSITVPNSAASEVVNENDVSSPFAGVTIADTAGNAVTVEIDYSASLGTLGPSGGYTSPGSGELTFTGSVSAANSGIDALHFTPAAGAAGLGNTVFTIHVTDSVAGVNVTDANTNLQVVAPVLTGSPGTQTVNVGTAFSFPTGVVFSDADSSDTYTATINYGDASVQVTTITPGQSISDIALANPYGGIGVGSYHLTVSVATAGGATSNSVSFTVNILPTASNLSYTTTANNSLTGDSLSAGEPGGGLDGSPLTFAVTSASHGTVTLTNSSTGAFTYAPTAGFSGVDSFTYTITSNGVTSTAATVTIDVDPTAAPIAYTTTAGAPLVESAAGGLASVAVGSSLSFAVSTPQSDGVLSLNSATGAFTYTPNAGFSGTDSFKYIVIDGSGLVSSAATVTITVDPTAANQTYTITANTPFTATTGDGLLVGAVGSGTQTVNFVTDPTHGVLSLENTNGTFKYTPTTNFSGIDTFTYTVTSGGLTSSAATVTIDVDPKAASQSYTTTADTPFTTTTANGLLIGAIGSGTETVTFASTPAHGALSLENTSNGTFEYTPTAGFSGTDTFTYTVTDGSGLTSSTATVTITVDPTAASQAYMTTANTPFTTTTGNGLLVGAVGSGSPTVTFVTSPTHGALSAQNTAHGTFEYTPTTGFSGTDTFTYTVTIGGLTSSAATVTITVDPTAASKSYTTTADTSFTTTTLNGLLVGAVGSGAQTVTFVTNPTDGALSLENTTNGTFKYTPTAGFSGIDTFTYTVTSGGLTSSAATVTIDVDPTAASQSYTTTADTPFTTTTANGLLIGAIGSGTETVTFASTPAHGALSLENTSNGTFEYTPTAGFSGTDTFTYTVTDGSGLVSAAATVTITVDPTAASQSYTTTADTPFTTTTGNGLLVGAVGSGTQTVTFVTNPTDGALSRENTTNGTFEYTPTTGFSGIDTFTYTVTSGGLTSSAATVTITVDPTTAAITYNTNANTALVESAGTGLATKAVGTSLTYAATAASNGTVVVNAANGSFTYTPTAGFSGTDTFTYTVTDSSGLVSTAATVTITVMPTAADGTFVTNENTILSVPAPGIIGTGHGRGLVAILVSESNVADGLLTLNPDGAFTFKPTADFVGTFSFNFKVSDGLSTSATHTITINVVGFIANTTTLTSIDDNQSATPFAGVTIVDSANSATQFSVTVTLGAAGDGTLAEAAGFAGASRFTQISAGVYTLTDINGNPTTDTSANVIAAIESLMFTPTAHLVAMNSTRTTTFTISVDDTFMYQAVTDATTKVTTTDINAAPTVTIGAVATSVDEGTAYSLSGVTFTPAYASDTYTATITWATGVTTTGAISGDTITGSETYFVYGSHSVSITVTDTNFFSGAPHADTAAFGSNSFTLTVIDVAPAISTTSADLGSQSTNLGTNFSLATAIAFADPGTADPFVASIQWGDGSSSVGVVNGSTGTIDFSAASHRFADAGSYNAQITLSDGEQTASPLTFTITVNDVAPTVTAPGGGGSVTLNLGSTLTLGFSYAGDGGAESFTYSASFGDGNTVANGAVASLTQGVASSATATTGTITFTYAEATELFGNPASNTPYTLTITVFDKNAAPIQQTQLQTFTITVLDVAPTLAIGAQSPVDVGALTTPTSITFASNAFANPASGYIPTYSYSIDWGDGTSSSTSSAAPGEGVTLGGPGVTTNGTIALQHAWPDSSATGYTVTVTVTDDHGGQTVETFRQIVSDVAPTIVTNPGTLTVSEGSTLPIGTIVFEDPSFADSALRYTPTFTYTINWGDGSTGSPDLQTAIANVTATGAAGVLTMGALNLSHFYAVTGNYTVTLKVADHHALDSTIETFHVTALDVPPVIQSLSFTQVSSVNMTTATGTVFDPGAAPLSVVINWADGTTTTIAALPGAAVDNFTATHTYLFAPNQADPAAPIAATVTVSDPFSGMSSEVFLIPVSGTGITSVTVQQQPQTIILAIPQTVVAQTPSYVAPSVLNVASAENVVVHTEQTNAIEDQVVMRVVTAIGKEGTNIPVPANVLDDLPGFFKRLPDGHYRVFFLQGDSNRERLLMDVQIRGGRPVDADEDSGTQDRPPSAQLDASPAFEQWRYANPAPSAAEQRGDAAVALDQPRSESAPSESTLSDLIRPDYLIFDEDVRATALPSESPPPADASAVFATPVSAASGTAPRWQAAIESGSTDRQRPSLLVGARALAGAALLVAEARSRAALRPAAPTAIQRQDASHQSIFSKASRLLKRLRTVHREQTSNSARLDESAPGSSSNVSAARIRN